MIRKVFTVVKKLIKEPSLAVKYSKDSIHVPLLMWFLAGVFVLMPTAFAIPIDYIKNYLLIIPDVVILGLIVTGGFWVYTWAVLVVGAKITGYKEKPKEMFKIVGYCFAPMFSIALVTTILSMILLALGFQLLNFGLMMASVIIEFVGFMYVLAHSIKKVYGDETLFVMYFALTLILMLF
ncbi:hypothetical protein ACFLQI_00535 [Candidatus Undinarchaeota archaeon]